MHGVSELVAQFGWMIGLFAFFFLGYFFGRAEHEPAPVVRDRRTTVDPFSRTVMREFSRLKAVEAGARRAMYVFDTWNAGGKPQGYRVEEEMAAEIGVSLMGDLEKDLKAQHLTADEH